MKNLSLYSVAMSQQVLHEQDLDHRINMRVAPAVVPTVPITYPKLHPYRPGSSSADWITGSS